MRVRSSGRAWLRGAFATATAAFGLLVAAPAAMGASVYVSGAGAELNFGGDFNEADNVTAQVTRAQITITVGGGDTIAEADPECEGNGTPTVVCTAAGDGWVDMYFDLDPFADGEPNSLEVAGEGVPLSVNGGDGADTLTVSGHLPAQVDLGAGDDTASLGSGNDRINDGGGADKWNGGAGNDAILAYPDLDPDSFNGGPGQDLVITAPATGTPDSFDGGDGLDLLLFAPVLDPEDVGPSLSVDLGAGTATGTTAIGNFEDVTTWTAGDTVTGTPGANRIVTSPDNEFLFILQGGYQLPIDGDDVVNPLGGPDHVATGAGDDRIIASDGDKDRIDCGAGTDTVQADPQDELIDCENVSIQFDTEITKKPKKKTSKSKATFKFQSVPAGAAGFECKLDKQGWKRCDKGKFKAKKLGKGKHKFLVRALDAQGNADPSPARYGWRVKAKNGGRKS